MCSLVIGLQFELLRKRFCFIENIIPQFRHEMASVNIEDFIPAFGNMHSQCKIFFCIFRFPLKHPSFIGKSKFHFIAVIKNMFSGNHLIHFKIGDSGLAPEYIFYLLFFLSKLFSIIQLLNFTSTANRKMFTRRVYHIF